MANQVKTAYFMFGRFNPPTVGHGSIFKKLAEDAKQDGADPFVFVSSTQDSDKNPLTVDQKIYYLEKLYGNLGIRFINTTTCELGIKTGPCKNPSFVIERLREAGYDKLVLYVGSDRIEDFQWMIKTNMKKLENGKIKYPIEIVNRMPPRNSNNFVASMSATKIRQAAHNDDIEFVKLGTGLSNNNARKLINEIRSVSGNQLIQAAKKLKINNKTPRRRRGGKRSTIKRSTSKRSTSKRSTCKANKK